MVVSFEARLLRATSQRHRTPVRRRESRQAVEELSHAVLSCSLAAPSLPGHPTSVTFASMDICTESDHSLWKAPTDSV
eukprot:362563-Chlamydomonas_euryale.AAC.2